MGKFAKSTKLGHMNISLIKFSVLKVIKIHLGICGRDAHNLPFHFLNYLPKKNVANDVLKCGLFLTINQG